MAEPRDAETVLKLFIGDLVLSFARVQAGLESVQAELDVANVALEAMKKADDGRSDDAAQ